MQRQFLNFTGRVLALLAGLAIATPAPAWGPQGHALIADIAAAHLSPSARGEIARLLAIENHDHLDQIASWADAVRSRRRETARWHYVDIPLRADDYQASRDCPGGNCVVARIGYFANLLGDSRTSSAERLEALKFVVHFVGDVQQPLHAADNNDRGGNDIRLRYFGHRSNLHAVWDSGIIKQALALYVHRNFSIDYERTRRAAGQLDERITRHEREVWTRGISARHPRRAAQRWATQAHRLARSVSYADLPGRPRRDWSQTYQRKTWPVARRQIQRGGVRLAALLNAVLSP